MDYNKIAHLSKPNEVLRYYYTNPIELYKYYAENCTLNEWLWSYYTNNTFAQLLLKNVKFSLWKQSNEITFEDYDVKRNDHKYLIHFLTINHTKILKLTISNELLKPSLVAAIEKLNQLQELSIEFKSDGEFPCVHLSSIETLNITISKNTTVHKSENILEFTKLKNLYIRGGILHEELQKTITSLKLSSLKLTYVNQKGEIPIIRSNIFKNKEKIEISNCPSRLLLTFITYCLHDSKYLSIYDLKSGLKALSAINWIDELMRVVYIITASPIIESQKNNLTNEIPIHSKKLWNIEVQLPNKWIYSHAPYNFFTTQKFRDRFQDITNNFKYHHDHVNLKVIFDT